ncbi:MAG: hypothetical protein ACREJR_00890, partial [Candidatus Rokuibacteriota bacterium]
ASVVIAPLPVKASPPGGVTVTPPGGPGLVGVGVTDVGPTEVVSEGVGDSGGLGDVDGLGDWDGDGDGLEVSVGLTVGDGLCVGVGDCVGLGDSDGVGLGDSVGVGVGVGHEWLTTPGGQVWEGRGVGLIGAGSAAEVEGASQPPANASRIVVISANPVA